MKKIRFPKMVIAILLICAAAYKLNDMKNVESFPLIEPVFSSGYSHEQPEETVAQTMQSTTTTEDPQEQPSGNIYQTVQNVNDVTEVKQEQGMYCIKNVPHILQTVDYPTGCESVAAVSLMQFYGIDITVDQFIDSYLPKADCPFSDGDVWYGESPWDYFIGDPRSAQGFGCYSTVIFTAMTRAIPKGRSVKTERELSLEDISEKYVANGVPVLVWATMNMNAAFEGKSWTLPDGKQFTFIRPEHALLLIGFDEDMYYFSDSLVGEEVTHYPKERCEAAFDALGRQAIVLQ